MEAAAAHSHNDCVSSTHINLTAECFKNEDMLIRNRVFKACVQGDHMLACRLLQHYKWQLQPRLLGSILHKMAKLNSGHMIQYLASLELDLFSPAISNSSLLQATEAAARSGCCASLAALLDMAAQRSTATRDEAITAAVNACSQGGHRAALRVALQFCAAPHPPSQQALSLLQDAMRVASKAVLQELLDWGRQHVDVDTMPELQLQAAVAALLQDDPRQCCRLLKHSQTEAPAAAATSQMKEATVDVLLQQAASVTFLQALSDEDRTDHACDASLHFAHSQLSSEHAALAINAIEFNAARGRCAILRSLLLAPTCPLNPDTRRAVLPRMFEVAIRHEQPEMLHLVLQLRARPQFQLEEGQHLVTTGMLHDAALTACSRDSHRLLMVLVAEISQREHQQPHLQQQHTEWLDALARALVHHAAARCFKCILHSTLERGSKGGGEQFWRRLVDGLIAKLQPPSGMQEGVLNHLNAEVFHVSVARPLFVEVLRCAVRVPHALQLLAARAGDIPWLPLVCSCVDLHANCMEALHVLLHMPGVLLEQLRGTPGMLREAVRQLQSCDARRVHRLLDVLWDSVTPNEQDEVLRQLCCCERLVIDRCALMARSSGGGIWQGRLPSDMLDALKAACKTGDVLFVQYLADAGHIHRVASSTSSRRRATVHLHSCLLHACSSGLTAATQAIASLILRTEPQLLRVDLDALVSLTRYGAQWAHRSMWLTRAWVLAPPHHTLPWAQPPWEGPVTVVAAHHFYLDPWCSLLPDFLACSQGRRYTGDILQACRQQVNAVPARRRIVDAVYRRVQWSGRCGSGAAGRRRIVLFRQHMRERTHARQHK